VIVWLLDLQQPMKSDISAYHHLNCEFESRSWGGEV